MSDQPTSAPGPAIAPASVHPSASDPAVPPPGSGWFPRLMSLLVIVFCIEVGLFLLIYPWTESWSNNYFAWAVRGDILTNWHSFWNNSYVRGGISGMGVVNLWIAVTEVFRLFARRRS